MIVKPHEKIELITFIDGKTPKRYSISPTLIKIVLGIQILLTLGFLYLSVIFFSRTMKITTLKEQIVELKSAIFSFQVNHENIMEGDSTHLPNNSPKD